MKKSNIFFVNIIVVIYLISLSETKISNQRLCADAQCAEVISLGTTLLNYNARDDYYLSFKANVKVKIYSKSIGTNLDLWGVEIDNKRGYIPSKLVVENKILIPSDKLTYVVATELASGITTSTISAPSENVPPITTSAIPNNIPNESIKIDKIAIDLPDNNINNIDNVDNITNSLSIENIVTDIKPTAINNELNVVDGTTMYETTSNETIASADSDAIQVSNIHNEPNNLANNNNNNNNNNINNSKFDKIAPENNLDKVVGVPKDDKSIGIDDIANNNNNNQADTDDDGDDDVDDDDDDNVDDDAEDDDAEDDDAEDDEDDYDDNTADSKEEVQLKNTDNVHNEPVKIDSIDLNNLKPVIEPVFIKKAAYMVTDDNNNINNVNGNNNNKENMVTNHNTNNENVTIVDTQSVTDELLEITTELPNVNLDETLPIIENVNETKSMPNNENINLNLQVNQVHQKITTDAAFDVVPPNEINDNIHSDESQSITEKSIEIITEIPNVELELDAPITGNLDVTTEIPNKHDYTLPNPNDDLTLIVNQVETLANTTDEIIATDTASGYSKETESTGNNDSLTEKVNIHIETIINNTDSQDNVLTEELMLSQTETISDNSQENEKVDSVVADVNNIVSETSKENIEFLDNVVTESPSEEIDYIVLTTEKNDVANENGKDGFFQKIYSNILNLIYFTKEYFDHTNDNVIEDISLEVQLDKIFNTKDNPNPSIDLANTVVADDEFCEKLSPNECPKTEKLKPIRSQIQDDIIAIPNNNDNNNCNFYGIEYDAVIQQVSTQFIKSSDIIFITGIIGFIVLLFTLGHYYIAKNRRENILISKLNILEKKLMTSNKECSILTGDLIDTRYKLTSIEDNSFGSNEMVISLKQELANGEKVRVEMQEQIFGLEKELENAAEAGLELNKMVSELLNNQSGSDSIISSVEELQKQLNEQQATSISINNLLAEKSRENSELQVMLSEQTTQYEQNLADLQKLNEQYQMEKSAIENQLEKSTQLIEIQLKNEIKCKNTEFESLNNDFNTLKKNYNTVVIKLEASEERVKILEGIINKLNSDTPSTEFVDLLDTVNLKTKLLEATKERDLLRDDLDGELTSRKLLDDHVKNVSAEVASLRQEYNQAEKDKLEAQTRLEVLSTYFKDKEMQLQKELSIKEAISMKQQGETTSTVERIRSLQEEIQEKKSQNDSLRAEIEAQAASYKAQIDAVESRAHESWLNVRQIDRRFQEARAEATALRRKLTSMGHITLDVLTNDTNAPSPIHADPSGFPPVLMGVPPPPFLPPPPPPSYMVPPPPFSPPPPILTSGELRLPPLGALMSPPPPIPPLQLYSPNNNNNHNSNRSNNIDDREHYSSDIGRYSPDMSYYETETDYSPPPSPRYDRIYNDYNKINTNNNTSNRNNSNNRHNNNIHHNSNRHKAYSPPPPPMSKNSQIPANRNKNSNKGGRSSGSIDSLGSQKSQKGKI